MDLDLLLERNQLALRVRKRPPAMRSGGPLVSSSAIVLCQSGLPHPKMVPRLS